MEKLLDPNLIDQCWSQENAIDWEEPSDRSDEIASMRKLRKHLTPDDKQLYDLSFIKNKTQCEVADILKITQPTVSFRIEQLTKVLRFLAFMPKIKRSMINANLKLLSSNRQKYLQSFLNIPNQAYIAGLHEVSPSNISKCITSILQDDGLDQEFIAYIEYLKTAPSLVFLN